MMGKKTRNSIQSFWKGKLSKAEAEDLLDELDRQQPNLQERLKTEFVEEDGRQRLLTPEQSDELLQAIRNRAGMGTSVRTLSPYRWIGVAAVLLVFSILGTLFILDQRENAARETRYAALMATRTYVVASQEDSLRHVLNDGSVVVLSPHSTIHYDQDYGANNRRLDLTGEGKFIVKRDSTLLFEVLANGFTTTALGTEFIVNGNDIDKTTVHLLSGKVVIRSTNEARMSIQDTYLAAGEILSIDEVQQTALTSTTLTPKPTVLVNRSKRLAPNATSPQPQNLRFDREDLTDVIQQIAGKFDALIAIDPEVPQNLTFTGEFSLSDSLETILHTICLVNDLQQERRPDNRVLIRLKESVYKQKADTTQIDSLHHN